MVTKPNMLKELTPLKDEWCIKVKIIRLWKLTVFKNPLETWKIEMVVQDEEVIYKLCTFCCTLRLLFFNVVIVSLCIQTIGKQDCCYCEAEFLS